MLAKDPLKPRRRIKSQRKIIPALQTVLIMIKLVDSHLRMSILEEEVQHTVVEGDLVVLMESNTIQVNWTGEPNIEIPDEVRILAFSYNNKLINIVNYRSRYRMGRHCWKRTETYFRTKAAWVDSTWQSWSNTFNDKREYILHDSTITSSFSWWSVFTKHDS